VQGRLGCTGIEGEQGGFKQTNKVDLNKRTRWIQ
jgi:hypothetical protein